MNQEEHKETKKIDQGSTSSDQQREPQVHNMTTILSHSPVSFVPGEPNNQVPLLTITTALDRGSPSTVDSKKINKNNAAYRECSNCFTTDSPIWRKGPNEDKLCNKCGLYWSRHNKHRPIQITRTRTKKPEGVTKRTNSPKVNSPRINSPRVNSPRINSPRVSSPLVRVNSPLISAVQHVENTMPLQPKFAYEEDKDNSSNLMLLLEAVQQSNSDKEDTPMQEKTIRTPPAEKKRRTMDLNGSAFKAVVRELSGDQAALLGQNGSSPNAKQPKVVSLVNRVLLM